MDINIIDETMLSLEADAFQSTREKYRDYGADAWIDRREPIEDDEHARTEVARDFSEVLDDTIYDHRDKLEELRRSDFGPKLTITKGAPVRLSERCSII